MTVSLRKRDASISRHRRRQCVQHRAFPNLAEDVDVKQMHHAEHEHHCAHLHARLLDRPSDIPWAGPISDVETDEAQVQQVESDDEELIDGISQRLISMEAIHEKDAAILVQGLRHPDRKRDAHGQVAQMRD